ncbi:hypothetical protein BDR26DRAFT_693948 [Obelidium mucronatum]|nr:hypothetical protein BDR26DRAFT_693948 [Obelidium mucronatum]
MTVQWMMFLWAIFITSIPTALDKEESGLENHESDSSFKKSIPLPPIESLSKRPSSSSISRNGSTPLSRPMSATVLGPIANSKPPSRPMSGYISEHASSHSRRTSLPALVKTLSSPSSRPLSGIRPILSKPESKDELKNRDSEMQLTESAQDHGDFAEEGPRAEAEIISTSHKESIDEAFEKMDNLLVAAQEQQRPAGDQSQLEILENDNQTQDFGVADEKENNVDTVMAKDVEHKDLLETIPSNEVHQPGGPIDLDEYEAKLETDADATAEQPTIGSNNTLDERNERQTTQKNLPKLWIKFSLSHLAWNFLFVKLLKNRNHLCQIEHKKLCLTRYWRHQVTR